MSAHTPLPRIGDWLGRSFRALGKRWGTLTLLGIAGFLVASLSALLVYAAAAAALYFFADREVLARLVASGGWQYVADDPLFRNLLFAVNALAGLVAVRAGSPFVLAAVHVSADPSLGFSRAWRATGSRSLSFTALVLIQQILVQIGMVLLILPGLILSVMLGFATLAFVRDKTGVLASLSASVRAVSGRFFAVLGRMIVLGFVCLAVAIVPLAGWIAAPCLAMFAWAELHRDLAGAVPSRPARPAPKPPLRPAAPRPRLAGAGVR